jgi:hypothetical protein
VRGRGGILAVGVSAGDAEEDEGEENSLASSFEQSLQFADLHPEVLSTSRKARKALLQKLMRYAKSAPEEISTVEFATQIVDIIFDTWQAWTDPSSQLEVEKLVQTLAATPEFVAAFFNKFVQACHLSSNCGNKRIILKLLKWSLLVMITVDQDTIKVTEAEQHK